MQISQNGLNLIKSFEGNGLPGHPFQAYFDGGGVATIGYGNTRHVTPQDVKSGRTITPQIAEQYLLEDIAGAQDAINRNVHVPLTQNQYDALVSFVFNLGPGPILHSGFADLLSARNYRGAADRMLLYCNDGGVRVEGLYNRRVKERALFLS